MKNIFYLFLFVISVQLHAQSTASYEDNIAYIKKYKYLAIEQMMQHGIPASITLAQGLVETNAGKSELATEALNHFGIKCKREWSGNTYTYSDDEENECFRAYNSITDSYKDHSEFLVSRKWYAHLFQLKIQDYKSWALGLKKAGYATDKKYAEKLIQAIETYQLNIYDVPQQLALKAIKYPSVTPSSPYYRFVDEHFIYYNNYVPYIIANKNDTYYRIAKAYNLSLEQLYSFNDLTQSNVLHINDLIYIEPKESKAIADYHLVKENETLYNISQNYGIKLAVLCRRNHINQYFKLMSGTILYLNKMAKNTANTFVGFQGSNGK